MVKPDVSKHVLVPEHTIMNKKEIEELRKEYKLDLKQLPKIKITDPVVKLIGADVGDVLKIKRISQTMGESLYYRFVVAY